MKLTLRAERFAYREPFRIAGHVFVETAVLVAELDDGEHRGMGEAAGVFFLGDDLAAMLAAAERVRPEIERGAGREALQSLLPPGGARNALDCAFWDLEAKRSGRPAWQLAGLDPPSPLKTTITLSAAPPEAMAGAARRLADWPMLKLKLTGEVDLDRKRVGAVRTARPDSWIAVDANQGYTAGTLGEIMPALLDNAVELIEQPLERGREADLDGIERPIPFAADESVCSLAELDRATGRFDLVNIKLDKCGGLTEGLAIARACRERGIGVMVGNMMGSSLSMAPSLLVGQLCDVVDLDGPTFLKTDRKPSVRYCDGAIDGEALDWGLPRVNPH